MSSSFIFWTNLSSINRQFWHRVLTNNAFEFENARFKQFKDVFLCFCIFDYDKQRVGDKKVLKARNFFHKVAYNNSKDKCLEIWAISAVKGKS